MRPYLLIAIKAIYSNIKLSLRCSSDDSSNVIKYCSKQSLAMLNKNEGYLHNLVSLRHVLHRAMTLINCEYVFILPLNMSQSYDDGTTFPFKLTKTCLSSAKLKQQ